MQNRTKYGTNIIECMKSGFENPDSSVGLYAPDPECYDTFSQIFYPVIRDYHKVNISDLNFVHDFGDPTKLPEFEDKFAEAILSTRIRVSRTVRGLFLLPFLVF